MQSFTTCTCRSLCAIGTVAAGTNTVHACKRNTNLLTTNPANVLRLPVRQHGRTQHSDSGKPRAGPRLPCCASLVDLLAFVPGICFDRQCQEAADRAFLIVTTIPLLGLLFAIILRFRPASDEKPGSDQVLNPVQFRLSSLGFNILDCIDDISCILSLRLPLADLATGFGNV